MRQIPLPAVVDTGAPGSHLTVYHMVMGQGDLVWERFGHNAIGVRDRRTGTDIVFNWGTFSFDQQGFIGRFLRGEMLYWLSVSDAAATVDVYRSLNRSVIVQELDLSPAQRLAMQEFVTWNAREENRFYRYDYFRDNCSTRVRDAIDVVLGGALKRSTDSAVTSYSFRDHALRLMVEDKLTAVGMDLGLGLPADRPITLWEEMFLPMSVAEQLRALRVPNESGQLVSLVKSEQVLFQATRAPERETPPSWTMWFLVAGLILAALISICAELSYRGGFPRGSFVALASLWSIVAGTLGILLLLLWGVTSHVYAYQNVNLFHFHPLWLVFGVLLLFARRQLGANVDSPTISARGARLLGRIGGLLSIAGVLALLVPALRQESGAIAAFAVPVNVAIAIAIIRLLPPSVKR